MSDPRPSPYHAGQPVKLVAGKRTFTSTIETVLGFDELTWRWRYHVAVDGMGTIQTDETALRPDSSRPDPAKEQTSNG